MCTAIRFNDRLFGRTLDFERSFGEELIVTPRGRMKIGEAENRYAIMGVGVKNEATPLYFDGVNEWGLSAAALNFPIFAFYQSDREAKAGVSSAHLIALLLGFCRSVREARDMLSNITITDKGADSKTPPTPQQWIISDPRECAVIESVKEGLKIYDNPLGVLTNSPELPYHLTRLADYSALSPRNPKAAIADLPLCSRGMGAIGLPGDFSSSSRFIRAAFLKENCHFPDSLDPTEDISHAFHILSSVSIPRGAVLTDEGEPTYTRYTALIDMDTPAYYLTTAACRTVRRAELTDSLCEGREIFSFPIYREEVIEEI